MKTFRRSILFGLLMLISIPSVGLAGKKPKKEPPPPPTEEEMHQTYDASVQRITALAKNPDSVRVAPIEYAWFGRTVQRDKEFIFMWLVFDGQNVFGATVRNTATCNYFVRGSLAGFTLTCSSSSGDLILSGSSLGIFPLPGMVQVPKQPKEKL